MSPSNLQEILQTEFPLIDSSLLAALLSDYQVPEIQVDDSSFQSIRDTLMQLTLNIHAHGNQDAFPTSPFDWSEHGFPLQTSPSLQGSKENDDRARDDTTSISGSTTLSITSMSSIGAGSGNINDVFASPVEFLNMLFPNLSPAVIDQAFVEHCRSGVCTDHEIDDNCDMLLVIDQLLSLEYIQDLIERGLDEPEYKNENGKKWKIVRSGDSKQGQKASVPFNPKKPKYPVHKITFVDIRQRQHIVKSASQSSTGSNKPAPHSFITDPWSRLNSISVRLSELLSPTPSGFFQSYFHAPKLTVFNSKTGWKMEGDALRSALSDLNKKQYPFYINNSKTNSPALQTNIDILRDLIVDPRSDDSLVLNGEQLLELERDARLCIMAANGNIDIALDLLWLLKELDEAFANGAGVAHLQPYTNEKDTQHPPLTPSMALAHRTSLKSDITRLPPSIPPPLSIKLRPPNVSHSNSSWTTVQRRSPKVVSSHVDHIPPYSNSSRLTQRHPVRGSGNRFGKGGKADIGELDRDLTWYRDQRKEALHQASQFWKSGSTKNRRGEIAFYYAEKARGFREQEHAKALEIARTMVDRKRYTSRERDSLDLHGLTIAEARVIVTEAVQAFDFSNARALTVITGRGKHSVDQVSVLAPAIRDMLSCEGYKVSTWDGGLIVRRNR